ncbi:transmembrane protein 186 [Hydra vulgaris]|uniref:Transmembrane protein 186 n=1 Tax=Hydra vulgaris TaxID=6087 RepID=T2M851_HYDVU|nr:transmembrane protein 186-like [Hydra vulgaris]
MFLFISTMKNTFKVVYRQSNSMKLFSVKHNFLNSVFIIQKKELHCRSSPNGNLKRNFMYNINTRCLSDLNTKWDVLYTFPHIKILGIISRFKMYQLAIMAAVGYPLYTMHLEGHISDVTLVYAGISSLGTVLLFIIYSYFATKVVGQLAVNQHDNIIRISHLSFYGRRIEEYVEIEKVIPKSDFTENNDFENVFQKLHIDKGNKKTYKYVYSLRYGNLFDRERFYRLLGIPSL